MSNDVAKPSAEVSAMQDDWAKVSALMGGTKAMRAAGKLFLPQWPAEDDESYQFRLSTSTLTNFYAHTIEVLGGKPFAKPINISEDMPEEMKPWLENVDTEGRNLHVFAHDVFDTALQYGISHMLVDYPRVAGVRTLAEERQIGARPYAAHIHPASVLGWKSQKVQGKEQLTQLRIRESVEEDDGEFGVKRVEQVRVLEPGQWRTFRKSTEANRQDEWVMFEEGATSIDFIPLVTVYTNRTGFMTAKPPLLDIADLNIKHWQSQSDQDAILHVARVPLLAVSGVDDGQEVVVGAKAFLRLPQGATAAYVEHSGAAIEAGRQSLQDLEEQMRVLGAELLVKKAGSVSATQAEIDNRNEQSALHEMAGNMEDALDLMIEYMAKWANVPNPGSVGVYKDFAAVVSGGQTETVLLNAATAGKLSDETWFKEMQRRGHIDDAISYDDERERLSEQGPALGIM